MKRQRVFYCLKRMDPAKEQEDFLKLPATKGDLLIAVQNIFTALGGMEERLKREITSVGRKVDEIFDILTNDGSPPPKRRKPNPVETASIVSTEDDDLYLIKMTLVIKCLDLPQIRRHLGGIWPTDQKVYESLKVITWPFRWKGKDLWQLKSLTIAKGNQKRGYRYLTVEDVVHLMEDLAEKLLADELVLGNLLDGTNLGLLLAEIENYATEEQLNRFRNSLSLNE